jgi:hypothetical protein
MWQAATKTAQVAFAEFELPPCQGEIDVGVSKAGSHVHGGSPLSAGRIEFWAGERKPVKHPFCMDGMAEKRLGRILPRYHG